ncbi:hypothetical protein QE152_g23085 [Popillia japonica]|uniref:Uncharacterized protein n=1 Tax=Popillia japonica TaxID=7064 RepID=A0AAW1KIY5_POPJA
MNFSDWRICCFSKMFSCFCGQDEWDQKEVAYIREVNKYKDLAIKIKEERDVMQQHFSQEYLSWQAKEAEYQEQIAALQNQLHQNEVVMQQYKIHEGNFQMDRQQFQENQKQIENYEKMVEAQQKRVEELQSENKRYLETILDLTRAAIGSEVEKELKKSESLNGNKNIAHITESVLV